MTQVNDIIQSLRARLQDLAPVLIHAIDPRLPCADIVPECGGGGQIQACAPAGNVADRLWRVIVVKLKTTIFVACAVRTKGAQRTLQNGINLISLRLGSMHSPFIFRLGLGLVALMAGGAQAGEAPPLSLELPLRCIPGQECWISNHVDLDPGPGAQDYTCGELTYNGHNGTDFALRDLQAMLEGVPVLAAAGGVVRSARDGEPDVSVLKRGLETVKGRECGNGVVIEHAEGWQTQYCHLRRGSVTVKPGDRVAAQEKLGLVGLSGETEYPHLHLVVRYQKTVVDPFQGLAGAGRCDAADAPLWKPAALAALPYAPGVIYNFGVASLVPSPGEVREGKYRSLVIEREAPVFAVWVELFGVTAGDVLEISLATPGGASFIQQREVLSKRQTRIFRLAAKKRGAEPWPVGEYRATITLARAGDHPARSLSFTAVVR